MYRCCNNVYIISVLYLKRCQNILILYSLQVHARFWSCSKLRKPGFCACGVATRDGDDVIVIDMCNGRFMETSVQISIKSKLPLAKGIRITEAISGKRYTVGLLTKKFKEIWVTNVSERDFWVTILWLTSLGKPLRWQSLLCEEPSLYEPVCK